MLRARFRCRKSIKFSPEQSARNEELEVCDRYFPCHMNYPINIVYSMTCDPLQNTLDNPQNHASVLM